MMKLLLDTHAFIWWASEPEKLSKKVRELCNDRTNILMLSVASVWEIQIKINLGKLQIEEPLVDLIEQQQQVNDLRIMPVELKHVLALENLADHHKDPFDRLLIAQSGIESLTLLSKDPIIRKYGVNVVW